MKTKNPESIVKRKGLYQLLDDHHKIKRFKPWLGDAFSFLYDSIMEKSVFPKKFGGSMGKHYEILSNIFSDMRGKNILDVACGSGDAVRFLHADNVYTGVDISKGLLHIASRKFSANGFLDAALYVADACDLPFVDDCFEMGICNLSLNFISNIDAFISEMQRVLKKDALFYCSVPVPEKKSTKAVIHGTLYTTEALRLKFGDHGFDFEVLPYENGALLYFRSRLATPHP